MATPSGDKPTQIEPRPVLEERQINQQIQQQGLLQLGGYSKKKKTRKSKNQSCKYTKKNKT
jgi:hypothetical protein